MNKIDTKHLKKLTELCRRCGIKSFKTPEFEFTLTESTPQPKRSRRSEVSTQSETVESDNLTDEQLLFYSVVDPTQASPQDT